MVSVNGNLYSVPDRTNRHVLDVYTLSASARNSLLRGHLSREETGVESPGDKGLLVLQEQSR